VVTAVFGARGNVGRNVAHGLRTAGEQVRVTSRGPGRAGFPDHAAEFPDHAAEFR
jgi:uncharacterized protein YbjT (DUF2867 family)